MKLADRMGSSTFRTGSLSKWYSEPSVASTLLLRGGLGALLAVASFPTVGPCWLDGSVKVAKVIFCGTPIGTDGLPPLAGHLADGILKDATGIRCGEPIRPTMGRIPMTGLTGLVTAKDATRPIAPTKLPALFALDLGSDPRGTAGLPAVGGDNGRFGIRPAEPGGTDFESGAEGLADLVDGLTRLGLAPATGSLPLTC